MFKLIIRAVGLDGVAVNLGGYDLNLLAPGNSAQWMPLGNYSSVANAKTEAAAIFKASLSWTDSAAGSTSAVFTS